MPTLGLSMIVRNAAGDLRFCLESVAGLVSQIVIADTGSTDHTAGIVQEFGAMQVIFPWTNHFADARNAALAPLTTDWVLVLDADEELSPESASAIPQLLASPESPDIGGYLLTIRNYLPDLQVQFRDTLSVPNRDPHPRASRALSWAEHDLCRLFRRDPRIRYTGRVHEIVEYSILDAGLRLVHAPIRILHFGQLESEETQNRKSALYRDLGRLKVGEDPTNGMAWFELGGIELSRFNNQPVALQCLKKAVTLEPRLLDAWILLFHLHNERQEFDHALAVYQKMASLNLTIPFFLEQRAGDYFHDRGQLPAAGACYMRALKGADTQRAEVSYASLAVVESKLGYTEVRLGDISGLARLQLAAEHAPHLSENQLRLKKALLLTGRLDLAEVSLATPAQSPSSAQTATP